MGIKDLQKMLSEHAPSSVRTASTKDYVNKKIAVDASILLYQFITSITTADGEPLKNAAGQVTSHLIGLLARCTRMAEAGVKPIFVFDGQAFGQKSDELEKRRTLKEENQAKADEAKQAGDTEAYKKYSKRSVKVGPEQYQQAVTLLNALGIQCIVATGEAEALAVALNRAGMVDAVASSDLDCVAYASKVFVRNLATDKDIIEIQHDKALEELKMDRDQFVDFCILLGCDYVPTIPSVGPKTAFQLIQKFKNIENILADKEYKIEPDYLQKVIGAREIFTTQNKLTAEEQKKYSEQLSQKLQIDTDAAVNFLVNEMQFDENNAKSRVEKFKKAKTAPKQMTLGAFVKKVDRK
ncbi:Flap_endonuclease 1 [Hexamita inflata]|uniref:Flap endonuclease 1 n=1 Tax=Hexamita inflata TaxID=28002 RepID=A0AA86PGN8_9EUKA|nr:Flap endonuclease 1 [Hexamita inflata]